jgi:ferredoxin
MLSSPNDRTTMKTAIYPDKCIGCTLCATLCPDIYKMEEDKAVVRISVIQGELVACAKNAAAQCPVEAIEITED